MSNQENDIIRDDIVSAVVAAWCTDENKNKVMDPVLAQEIITNVFNLLVLKGKISE